MNQADFFYEKKAVGTNDFKDTVIDIDFAGSVQFRVPTGSGVVEFSWNGNEVHGEVNADDGFLKFENVRKGKIHLRAPAASTIKVWAWVEE